MLPENRLQTVKEFIQSRGEVTTSELQRFYADYSAMTLWRDLKLLEDQGCIRRIHGGAISMLAATPQVEGIYSKRAREHIHEKNVIARAAIPYISTGHAVYLDAGSTTMNVANLMGQERFTVITSGANIAIELSQRHTCDVLLTGGQISENTLSCSGETAEAFVRSINIDLAIMSSSGYSLASGFTIGSHSESMLKRCVIERASRVIMLMDSSKFNRSLPFTFASFSDIETLITDSVLSDDIALAARDAGVQIVIAE